MKKLVEVPTGHIGIIDGEEGPLEFVSLGDYGKEKNLKADFLGLEKEIEGVPHGELLPLSEKWVITISTQYGCSMGCKFCDVPKVGPGKNASYQDMIDQIKAGLSLHPEVTRTNRLNIHFARMGEPTWNANVFEVTEILGRWADASGSHVHPVISTMMPKHNKTLRGFIDRWCYIKNYVYDGEAGLQLSINSTNEAERDYMFSGNALPLRDMNNVLPTTPPRGRKYTLNFALADYEIDPEKLYKIFDPEWYICKLTPMHKTATAEANEYRTDGGYDYYYPCKETETKLKEAGYDVIVFVPSKEEDESRITCGNAILSDEI